MLVTLATAAAAMVTPPPAIRHYINLSNGLEALKLLEESGVPASQLRFMRLQSSHCEAQDFNGILQSLDSNLLMHLALGFECRIYDYGSRGNYWEGPDGQPVLRYVPRAMWWGLEWSRFALTKIWHLEGSAASAPPLLRGYNVQSLFDEQLHKIPKPLWKKLKYYRSHLAPGLSEVQLRGYYASTELDGNKDKQDVISCVQPSRRRRAGPPRPCRGSAAAFAAPDAA